MGPRVQREEQRSQATPLGNDFLKILQGQIAEGSFGQGAGPLQRHAGTALEQYLNSIQERVSSGQDSNQTSQLISSLTKGSETRTNRQAADLREGFGAAGNRFGSAGALGEARLRGDVASNLDQTIGGIRTNQAQFDAGQLLNTINLLQNLGQGNVDLFSRFAQMGILPEELIVSPGIGDQILSGLLQNSGKVAQAVTSGGAANARVTPQFDLFSSGGTGSSAPFGAFSNVSPSPFQLNPNQLRG